MQPASFDTGPRCYLPQGLLYKPQPAYLPVLGASGTEHGLDINFSGPCCIHQAGQVVVQHVVAGDAGVACVCGGVDNT